MSFVGFKVNKGGTAQALGNGTMTLITWSVVQYNVNLLFASNLWTPPAGKISLIGQIYMTATAFNSGAGSLIGIQKNGVLATPFIAQFSQSVSATECTLDLTFDDIALGTDTYGLVVQGNVSSGGLTLSGDPTLTNFSGYVLDP